MNSILSMTYKPMHSEKNSDGFDRVAVQEAHLIAGYGIDGDRKGGHPKRQLNILSSYTLACLLAQGYDGYEAGGFGEQMVIDGIDVDHLRIGTRLQLGETACVEITMHRTGCPKLARLHGKTDTHDDKPLGVMVRVLKNGFVRVGDTINVLEMEIINDRICGGRG